MLTGPSRTNEDHIFVTGRYNQNIWLVLRLSRQEHSRSVDSELDCGDKSKHRFKLSIVK